MSAHPVTFPDDFNLADYYLFDRIAEGLGSKAAVKELADASMAMKLLIEQMREQVQNLE